MGRAAPPLPYTQTHLATRIEPSLRWRRLMDARWTDDRMKRLARMMAVGVLLVAAASGGCKHRRSSLRPVFVDPEPVLLSPSPSSATVIPTEPVPYDDVVTTP